MLGLSPFIVNNKTAIFFASPNAGKKCILPQVNPARPTAETKDLDHGLH